MVKLDTEKDLKENIQYKYNSALTNVTNLNLIVLSYSLYDLNHYGIISLEKNQGTSIWQENIIRVSINPEILRENNSIPKGYYYVKSKKSNHEFLIETESYA